MHARFVQFVGTLLCIYNYTFTLHGYKLLCMWITSSPLYRLNLCSSVGSSSLPTGNSFNHEFIWSFGM